MQNTGTLRIQITRILCMSALLLGLFASVGSAQQTESSASSNSQEAAVLIEGDVILISFPAAEDLNTSQKTVSYTHLTLPTNREV